MAIHGRGYRETARRRGPMQYGYEGAQRRKPDYTVRGEVGCKGGAEARVYWARPNSQRRSGQSNAGNISDHRTVPGIVIVDVVPGNVTALDRGPSDLGRPESGGQMSPDDDKPVGEGGNHEQHEV